MKHNKLIFFILIFFTLSVSSSCSFTQRIFGKKYKNEKAIEDQRKEFDKNYEALKEAHWKRQPERTQEMMKESRKRSKKLNRSKREPWWKRLLGIDK